MAVRSARVFTIPHGVDFPDTLAAALLDGRVIAGWPEQSDPLALSLATIYLPTRRAARALSERLAARIQSDAVILPKIIPLGGFDEAEDRMILDQGVAAFDRLEFQPEIEPARRRLILARLITAWSSAIEHHLSRGEAEQHFARSMVDALKDDQNGFIVAASPRDALQLADALGQLIDTLTIHEKSWEDIHDLVPQDLADDYWKISRDFLEIAAREWPGYCKANQVLDAAERRHRLILAEADRLSRDAPTAPVIAAGSTGTMPATAALIAAIAHLPNGAVILPGLDLYLDDSSFDALADADGRLIEPQHPQAQLRRLLRTIGIERDDVPSLGTCDGQRSKRMQFLSEALRPVSTTDQWQSRSERLSDADIAEAFAKIKIIEAAHEREEAIAIAIALREALEATDKTAALITPDRSLAERVQSELKRWQIEVEDSAGMSLARTPAGQLALLLAEALAQNFSPWSLLALIAHPAVRLQMDPAQIENARRALDIGLFRHVQFPRGLEAVELACRKGVNRGIDHHRPKPEQRLTVRDWQDAIDLIARLKAICASFRIDTPQDLVANLPWHEQALRAIVSGTDIPDAWDDVFGASELQALLQSVAPSDDLTLPGGLADYPGFLDGLMRGTMVRDHRPAHPRIKIFGLLEARLLPVDLVVLAGLDESVWPPEIKTDPFLNRPWREALMLPAPERRIGQTAHDLVSAMGADDVILTRALKRSGSPTVASRFIQRMRAVAGDVIFDQALTRGRFYSELAFALDAQVEADFEKRIAQPQPILTRELLPTQLSVTKIETLRRDPYSIFAQYVLGLDALEMIEPEIGASEIGNAFHEALAAFGKAHAFALPDKARPILLECGRKSFASLSDQPEFSAFWWPRFERAADWYLEWEATRRDQLASALKLEERGALTFPLPRGGEFTLTARADRIELHADHQFSVIDYKTGQVSSVKEVRIGLAPQLTLEAAMVKRGAFENIAARATRDLAYVKIGSRDGGMVRSVVEKDRPADGLVDQHYHQLIATIDAYWNGGKPFASRPIAQFASRYSNYDHLARVKEWAMNADDEGDGS